MSAAAEPLTEGNDVVHDGFDDVFAFREHRLPIKGYNMVDVEDGQHGVQASEFNIRHHYISWDTKQVMLWENNINNNKPTLLHQIRSNISQSYICSIVLVTKMKVFLGAALDMSFKIYDKKLNLLEGIRHEERAILHLEYDPAQDIIISAGASGVCAWRLYRNTMLDAAHIMEKLYVFEGCSHWVSKLLYEPQFDRIYALKDRSVQVLSVAKKGIVAELTDVHDAPVNVICWYARTQFYITGCSRGEIKCWTSHHSKGSSRTSGTGGSNSSGSSSNSSSGDDGSHSHGHSSSSSSFALLHAFKGHSRGVTAIKLHPISGLAISCGLDGVFKVLNLEALSELFSVTLDEPIIDMKVVPLGKNMSGCLFVQGRKVIRMWRITSVADFYAVSGAKIDALFSFENLEYKTISHHLQAQKAREAEWLLAGGGGGVAQGAGGGGGMLAAYIHAHNRGHSHQQRPDIPVPTGDAAGDAAGDAHTNTNSKLAGADSHPSGAIARDDKILRSALTAFNTAQRHHAAVEDVHSSTAIVNRNLILVDEDEEDEGGSDEELMNQIQHEAEQNTEKNQRGSATATAAMTGADNGGGSAESSDGSDSDSSSSNHHDSDEEEAAATAEERYNQSGTKAKHKRSGNRKQTQKIRPHGRAGTNARTDTTTTVAAGVPLNSVGRSESRVLVTSSRQDLRVYSSKGVVMGRLEPEFIVDGIKAVTVSVYQKLIFCLCERDLIRVHDLNQFSMPLVAEQSIWGKRVEGSNATALQRASNAAAGGGAAAANDVNGEAAVGTDVNITSSSGGVGGESDFSGASDDLATTCVLINVLPDNASKASSSSKQRKKRDLLGNRMPSFLEAFLLVGMKNGSLIFIDTLNDLETQMNIQAHTGIIVSMKFRSTSNQLLVLGSDFAGFNYSVRVWGFPAVTLLYEISGMQNVTAFNVSPSIGLLGVGTAKGSIRLYHTHTGAGGGSIGGVATGNTGAVLAGADGSGSGGNYITEEVISQEESHKQKINSLVFCDELRVLFSCCAAGELKVWNYEKQLVRTVRMNLECPSLVMSSNGSSGDVIIIQGHYLLTVLRTTWDEGNARDKVKAQVDPWLDEDVTQNSTVMAAAAAFAEAGARRSATRGSAPPPQPQGKEDQILEALRQSVNASNAAQLHKKSEGAQLLDNTHQQLQPQLQKQQQSQQSPPTVDYYGRPISSSVQPTPHPPPDAAARPSFPRQRPSHINSHLPADPFVPAADLEGNQHAAGTKRNIASRGSLRSGGSNRGGGSRSNSFRGVDTIQQQQQNQNQNSKDATFVTQRKSDDPYLPFLDPEEFIIVRKNNNSNTTNNDPTTTTATGRAVANSFDEDPFMFGTLKGAGLLDVRNPRFLLHRKPAAMTDHISALEERILNTARYGNSRDGSNNNNNNNNISSNNGNDNHTSERVGSSGLRGTNHSSRVSRGTTSATATATGGDGGGIDRNSSRSGFGIATARHSVEFDVSSSTRSAPFDSSTAAASSAASNMQSTGKKMAMLGLSPRARMTLLTPSAFLSTATASSNNSGNSNNRTNNNQRNSHKDGSTDVGTDSGELISESGHSGSNGSTALLSSGSLAAAYREQEKAVFASLSMKLVANSYKERIIRQKQQRDSTFQEAVKASVRRSTMLKNTHKQGTFDTTADQATGGGERGGGGGGVSEEDLLLPERIEEEKSVMSIEWHSEHSREDDACESAPKVTATTTAAAAAGSGDTGSAADRDDAPSEPALMSTAATITAFLEKMNAAK